MKIIFTDIAYVLLGFAAAGLEALIYLAVLPVALAIKLFEKIRYEAQCLRYPPPPGGMYGAIARHIKEKHNEE